MSDNSIAFDRPVSTPPLISKTHESKKANTEKISTDAFSSGVESPLTGIKAEALQLMHRSAIRKMLTGRKYITGNIVKAGLIGASIFAVCALPMTAALIPVKLALTAAVGKSIFNIASNYLTAMDSTDGEREVKSKFLSQSDKECMNFVRERFPDAWQELKRLHPEAALNDCAETPDLSNPWAPADNSSSVRSSDSIKEGFVDALRRFESVHGKGSIINGADGARLFELLDYMGGGPTSVSKHGRKFLTGREVELISAVKAESDKTKKKLSPEDLFSLSLELHEGNIYKSMLCCHNMLRQLGRDGYVGDIAKDSQFFNRYFNADFTGPDTNDPEKTIVDDSAGNWYYFFGVSAMNLAANYRNHRDLPFVNLAKDMMDLARAAGRLCIYGIPGAALQIACDAVSSVFPADYVLTKMSGKSISQAINEKLQLDRINFPSLGPGSILTEFAVTLDQLFYKVGEPSRADPWQGGNGTAIQRDRYSVIQAALNVGEALAHDGR